MPCMRMSLAQSCFPFASFSRFSRLESVQQYNGVELILYPFNYKALETR